MKQQLIIEGSTFDHRLVLSLDGSPIHKLMGEVDGKLVDVTNIVVDLSSEHHSIKIKDDLKETKR